MCWQLCCSAQGRDHCHSRGAAHGHASSGLIFINISRLSGSSGPRSASVLVANNCHHASLSLRPSDTIHNPPDVALFKIHNTTIMGRGWMSTSFIEWDLKGCWSLSLSCIQAMNADTKVPGQHNFLIQYSLLCWALKFCGCRTVKTSFLLSVTFVLSLEARLEDGLH